MNKLCRLINTDLINKSIKALMKFDSDTYFSLRSGSIRISVPERTVLWR